MKRLVVWSISIILIIYLGVLGQKGGREEQIIRAKREMKYNICLPRQFELSCLALMVPLSEVVCLQSSFFRIQLNISVAQCFCVNRVISQATLTGEKSYETPCDGNKTQACGGARHMRIFQSKSSIVANFLLKPDFNY